MKRLLSAFLCVCLLLQLLALKLQSAQRVRHLGNLRLFFIAEVHQALQLAESQGLDAMFILQDGSVLFTPGFEEKYSYLPQ